MGRGWEADESKLRLQGWTRARRVVVLRRQVRHRKQPEQNEPKDVKQRLLPFAEVVEAGRGPQWEYAMLLTSRQGDRLMLAQLYRNRVDFGDAFDELQNQWGWGGVMTQELRRTRIMVQMNALSYNWWSV